MKTFLEPNNRDLFYHKLGDWELNLTNVILMFFPLFMFFLN